MSSLTIDQLKSELASHGVPLPGRGAKKEDYVKLYKQFVKVSDSNNEIDSSEDDIYISQGSSQQEPDSLSLENQITGFTDEELFTTLKENGVSCGPIVPTTRRVYELKLIKLLSGQSTNGRTTPTIERNYRDSTPVEVKLRASVDRATEFIRDERIDVMNYRASMDRRSMTPDVRNRKPANTSPPTSYSFIERIPKGSNIRIIDSTTVKGDFSKMALPPNYKLSSEVECEPSYRGKWSPNINKYIKPQTESRITEGVKKVFVYGIGLMVIIAVGYYAYLQFKLTDPYQSIEEDIQQLTEGEKN